MFNIPFPRENRRQSLIYVSEKELSLFSEEIEKKLKQKSKLMISKVKSFFTKEI